MTRNLRLAVVVSHPIPHFVPWHRKVAQLGGLDLKVFFCCDWGTEAYFDRAFGAEFKWDIPLLDGYAHEFLPIRKRPETLNYWQVDNPAVGRALDDFQPDVVKVFGYNYRTNWRAADWTRNNRKPLLLYSDSNGRAPAPAWKRLAKRTVVSRFYSRVDGALFVGDNNFAYHQRYGLPQERLFTGSLPIDQDRLLNAVPNREETRRELRNDLGIPQDGFLIILCGKYVAYKRPVDLLAAAWMAKQEGFPIWSILVGEGPARREIEDFCRSQQVTNTILTGFVNQSRIAEYYVASDAIAVTSSLDNHPLVLSEGASFGLPAIVSDQLGCIGANDTARPDVNAIVYPCGDRNRLKDAIERLYQDQNLYRRMSAASSKIAETQDVAFAARQLADAAHSLNCIGPRRR